MQEWIQQDKKSLHKAKTGQTLLEVVVAIGIVVVILVALMSGVVSSLRNVRFSKNISNGTQYAQEGLEALRSIRDRSYLLIETNGDTYGLNWTGTQWDIAANPDVIDIFTRTVKIEDTVPQNSNLKQVTVIISWQEGDDLKNTTLTTILARLN